MNICDIEIGDEVICVAGGLAGEFGTVCVVDPGDDTALVEFSFGKVWEYIEDLELCGQQTAAEINIAFDDFLSAMEEDGDEVL